LIPDDIKAAILISKNGTLWVAKEYEIGQWEPILRLVDTDADNVNTWTKERYTCTFYPDYAGAPGTSYSVKILNEKLPMQRQSDDGPTYEGQLIIRETGP
jgi:hypothetical protein